MLRNDSGLRSELPLPHTNQKCCGYEENMDARTRIGIILQIGQAVVLVELENDFGSNHFCACGQSWKGARYAYDFRPRVHRSGSDLPAKRL